MNELCTQICKLYRAEVGNDAVPSLRFEPATGPTKPARWVATIGGFNVDGPDANEAITRLHFKLNCAVKARLSSLKSQSSVLENALGG